MGKNSFLTLIIAIAVIVVAGIIFFVFANNSKQNANPTTNNQVTENPESAQDISPQDKGIAAQTISYGTALAKYADRRIQLDLDCQAHPNNVTYKDNTGIMIDNRSPKTRTVKIGSTFTIKPWSFKIVVLPDVYLKSKTLLVDCDQSQNVATILVQE